MGCPTPRSTHTLFSPHRSISRLALYSKYLSYTKEPPLPEVSATASVRTAMPRAAGGRATSSLLANARNVSQLPPPLHSRSTTEPITIYTTGNAGQIAKRKNARKNTKQKKEKTNRVRPSPAPRCATKPASGVREKTTLHVVVSLTLRCRPTDTEHERLRTAPKRLLLLLLKGAPPALTLAR